MSCYTSAELSEEYTTVYINAFIEQKKIDASYDNSTACDSYDNIIDIFDKKIQVKTHTIVSNGKHAAIKRKVKKEHQFTQLMVTGAIGVDAFSQHAMTFVKRHKNRKREINLVRLSKIDANTSNHNFSKRDE